MKTILIRKYSEILKDRHLFSMDQILLSEYLVLINNILLLISDDVVSETNMRVILDDSNEKMDILNEHLSTEKFILISNEIIIALEEMIVDTIECEMFEAAANIKKFYEQFYRV